MIEDSQLLPNEQMESIAETIIKTGKQGCSSLIALTCVIHGIAWMPKSNDYITIQELVHALNSAHIEQRCSIKFSS